MVELYAHHYKLAAPGTEHVTSRGVRRSPLHDSLAARGAVFGSRGGWERPNWFAPAGVEPVDQPSFSRAELVRRTSAEEHRAVRERVALIDQTSFAKFEITGPGALDAVQWLSVADMDKPVGTITYTQLCNERGGIECDLTMTRTRRADTGTSSPVRRSVRTTWVGSARTRPTTAACRSAISRRPARSSTCAVRWRATCCRRSARTTSATTRFRYATARDITIGVGAGAGDAHRLRRRAGMGAARAHRVRGARLRVAAARPGSQYGIANVGYRAIDTLRMEKGYLYWSTDITPDTTPWEAGLELAGQPGQGRLLRSRRAGRAARRRASTRKLCTFTLEQMAYPVSGEAIIADGDVVGFTTSANFGHTIGKPIAYGYLPIELADRTDFVIEVYGEPIPATRHDGALYDPKNLRLKS